MKEALTKDKFSFKDVNTVEEAVLKLNYIIGLIVLLLGPFNLIFGSILSLTNLLSSIYYILFGMMILSANMKISYVEDHFKFLSNKIGRGIFTIYIGTLYFNFKDSGVLQVVFWVLFLVLSFIGLYYIYEGLKSSKTEKDAQLEASVTTIRGI